MYIGNNEIKGLAVGNSPVIAIYQGTTPMPMPDSGDTPDIDYTVPLTFEIIGDGYILWKSSRTAFTATIEYKLNDGSWTSITSATGNSAPSILVASGDTVQFRGDNATYCVNYSNCGFQTSTAQFKVKGNIMSLINSTNFSTLTTLSSTQTFYQLFLNCHGLIDISNLLLPATTLTNDCYCGMFNSCTGLTDASNLILPATTLAKGCYQTMFINCFSLTTAPQLPATTLAQSCYSSMFSNCRSLTTAPNLPVTTLAQSCYGSMFAGCRSLTQAPVLPATTLTDACYYNMFNGCTSLTQAPELPATTLAQGCYSNMFAGCSNLNYIKCLATDISASNCTYYWVSGVSSSGTFICDVNTDWSAGESGIPLGWATDIPYLVLTTAKIKLTEYGASTTFDVITSKPWTATTVPDWVSLSQTTGASGTTTITVTAVNIPPEEVEDSIIISNTYQTATITVDNITLSRKTFGEWYSENEENLMNGEDVVLCQTLFAEGSFLDRNYNNFEATGETSGERYNIDMMSGRIDVSPDYNITQDEVEIDGHTYKTVDFGETVKVNDQMKMNDLNVSCQDYYDAEGIYPVMLE